MCVYMDRDTVSVYLDRDRIFIRIKVYVKSPPFVSIEHNNSPLVGHSSQLIILIRHILYRIYLPVIHNRIVIPEPLCIGQLCIIIVLDDH